MKKHFELLAVLSLLFSCGIKSPTNKKIFSDSLDCLDKQNILSHYIQEVREISCDSIYPNKGYKIKTVTFSEFSYIQGTFNTVFSFTKIHNNKETVILRDSLQCFRHEVLFQDYNKDKVKDILIENSSSARSDVSYYLYLLDSTQEKITKVKGFEAIFEPKYNSKYNLVENFVMGDGRVEFYQIQGDTVLQFEPVINGMSDRYEDEYAKAISRILKSPQYKSSSVH